MPRYQHEVAPLLRDRPSGKPLFEARAGSEGFSSLDDTLLAAMFEAALFDFPRLGINPRLIVVPLMPLMPLMPLAPLVPLVPLPAKAP